MRDPIVVSLVKCTGYNLFADRYIIIEQIIDIIGLVTGTAPQYYKQ